ncbi:MAG: hypothetical protein U0790_21180 [Isosphaeraceae bacterium]
MGLSALAVPRREPPGVLYWLSRAVLCLFIAPILGLLFGLVAVLAGMVFGELAALAVLLLFLAELARRLVPARRPLTRRVHAKVQLDPDLDRWS